MSETTVALNSLALPEAPAVPEWICLLPAGQVTGRDGRSWINDDPEGIVTAFNQSGMDAPVDMEHSTEIQAPKGNPAPASGWVKELKAINGELHGRVEWTEKGHATVAAKEYRYISPVIVYQRATNRITGLTSVGLTNRPNLYLPALNSTTPPAPLLEEKEGGEENKNREETHMMNKMLQALDLPDGATEEAALNRIAGLKGDLATALNRADSPSLEKFVPRADHDAALARATNAESKLGEVQTMIAETAINAEIDVALKEGKITPATVEYHRASCRQEGGLDRFKAFCQAAPAVAADTGLDDGRGTARRAPTPLLFF